MNGIGKPNIQFQNAVAQINIEDVFVSKVTEQFLNYIEFMKSQPHRDVDKEKFLLYRPFCVAYSRF